MFNFSFKIGDDTNQAVLVSAISENGEKNSNRRKKLAT